MNKLILDVENTGMCGYLYRDSGEKIFEKQVCYQPVCQQGGIVELPLQEIEDAMTLILRAVCSREKFFRGQLESVMVTSSSDSVFPVDSKGLPLMAAMLDQDTRNIEICRILKQYEPRVKELSGSGIECDHSGAKMLWIRVAKPEIYQQICKFVNIPGYMIYLMTGRYITDDQYAKKSNLMNQRTGKWDKELIQLFHVRQDHLCEIKKNGTVAAHVSTEYAASTGLRSGTPIISLGREKGSRLSNEKL